MQSRSKSDNELGVWFKNKPKQDDHDVSVGGTTNTTLKNRDFNRFGSLRYDYLSRRAMAWTVASVAVLLIAYIFWDFWFVRKPLTELNLQKPKDDVLPFDISTTNILFEIGSGSFISLTPTKPIKESAEIKVLLDDPDIVDIPIHSFTIDAESTPRNYFIPLHSKDVAGHCVVSFKTNSKLPELRNLFKLRVQVKVVHQIAFGYLSVFVGWMYFCFWSTCYYPQIYQNYRRKSVVGFSFDYLALNITGHICYFIFNFSMYTNNYVQKEFTDLHPKAQIPVHLNDVLFSVHAISMNLLLLCQCLIYERGDQRVSIPMRVLVGGVWLTIIGALIGAIMQEIAWLQYLYYLSYIKVGTTPIKYTPQVYLNYARKSTEGWSIQGVMLDVGGGVSSFAQMVIDAVNNDDWDGSLGNPGKLMLSCVGLTYDAIFLSQHFIFFRSGGSSGRKRKNTDCFADQHVFSEKLNKLKASFELTNSEYVSKHSHRPRVQNL